MEQKDILKSLAELEATLKGIESAKKQVETVVAAYSQLGTSASAYSNSIADISSNLATIIANIKEKNDVLQQEASAILDAFQQQCTVAVEAEESSLKVASSTFATDCNAVVENAKTAFKGQVDNLDSTLSAKCLALSASISNLNAEIAKLESLHSLIKSTLDSVSTLKGDVKALGDSLTESQSNQDKDLALIKTNIETFLEDVKAKFTSLQNKLEESQKGQDDELKKISRALTAGAKQADENSAALSKEIAALQDATKTNKTLTIICLVSIIITMVAIFIR